ncbi:hypothetical protein BH09PLA1_BH09PLA1_21680 [soil metagenome]
MKKTSRKKRSYFDRFLAMTDAQRDAEVSQFDREFVPTKPLTKADKKLLERARRKPGRPRVGRGARRLTITLERGLVERADALARRKHWTRSELIARGVQTLLKAG